MRQSWYKQKMYFDSLLKTGIVFEAKKTNCSEKLHLSVKVKTCVDATTEEKLKKYHVSILYPFLWHDKRNMLTHDFNKFSFTDTQDKEKRFQNVFILLFFAANGICFLYCFWFPNRTK